MALPYGHVLNFFADISTRGSQSPAVPAGEFSAPANTSLVGKRNQMR